MLINCSISTHWNAEQQISIFTHYVNKGINYLADRFVGIVVINGTFVMPIANAGTSLPWNLLYFIAKSSFNIFNNTGLLFLFKSLGSYNCFDFSVMPPGI